MRLSRSYTIRFSLMVLVAALLQSFAFAQPPLAPTEEQAELQKRMRKLQESQMILGQLGWIQHNHAVREELEISDEQIAELQQVGTKYQQAMQKVMLDNREKQQEMQKLFQAGEHEAARKLGMKLQEEMFELVKPTIDTIETALLPHQLKRIRQISRQQTLKAANKFGDEFGIAFALRRELGLTDEESSELEKVIKESRQEYYERLNELRAEINGKIMAAIPKSKRSKLKEIIGDEFDREKAQRTAMIKMREQAEKNAREMRERMLKQRENNQSDRDKDAA